MQQCVYETKICNIDDCKNAWCKLGLTLNRTLRVWSWAGSGGLVKYWGGLSAEDAVTHPSTNQARRTVTSLIRPTVLLLRHAATTSCSEYKWHQSKVKKNAYFV